VTGRRRRGPGRWADSGVGLFPELPVIELPGETQLEEATMPAARRGDSWSPTRAAVLLGTPVGGSNPGASREKRKRQTLPGGWPVPRGWVVVEFGFHPTDVES